MDSLSRVYAPLRLHHLVYLHIHPATLIKTPSMVRATIVSQTIAIAAPLQYRSPTSPIVLSTAFQTSKVALFTMGSKFVTAALLHHVIVLISWYLKVHA
ncbi:hypothetical protein L2E82_49645 [Cichorium intybus]|uniref:Uncharacterized protein n=1 Tax=Cichorium intybus TaxID=13427 RepID=A0ACB8Z0K2_CICIN|nr:hypothetical protein L2E82_49645 [Cichorium intybus]